jgi:putative zinc finger protein
MKQETNNEMDLLLRQWGQRQDVLAPGAEHHLDTDELNAYAENVLPAKTRARYTAHLAECSRCRELVVQLSGPAGVVVAEETARAAGPSGWRKFLASLLSPMVLRYAAPALGLIVVAVIGVVVLRRNNSHDLVSQVQNDQARPAGVAQLPESNQATSSTDTPTKSLDSLNKEVPKKNEPQQSPTPVPQGTPAAVAQNAPAAKAPEAKPEPQPVVAAEAPPPAPASVNVVSDNKQIQNEDTARKVETEVKVAPKDTTTRNFELGRATKKGEEPATVRARVAKNKSEGGSVASVQGAAAPGSARREKADRDDEERDVETKSVAGRQFRKQGGIWTDTAYDSSRGAMNLTRNSEAYRTLVADEPGIKTIADQLDGEIIVVWKGRAYHIH